MSFLRGGNEEGEEERESTRVWKKKKIERELRGMKNQEKDLESREKIRK